MRAPLEGTLTLAPGEVEAPLVVTIIDDTRWEQDETFRVELSCPSEGAQLAKGGRHCVVTILNDDALPEHASKLSKQRTVFLSKHVNQDKCEVVAAEWREQFTMALFPAGSADEEGPGSASCASWVLHATSVVWKVRAPRDRRQCPRSLLPHCRAMCPLLAAHVHSLTAYQGLFATTHAPVAVCPAP